MIPSGIIGLPSMSLRGLVRCLRDAGVNDELNLLSIESAVGASVNNVAAEIVKLRQRGFSPSQIAEVLELIIADRARQPRLEDILELVVTGPNASTVPMRNTIAAFSSLVSSAKREILLVGYAVHDGKAIFREIAERMDDGPELSVKCCLNIHRQGETAQAQLLVQQFADDFKRKQWPGKRIPELYYYPPSLALDSASRASLHAKFVIVDRQQSFITSANFTEAAQTKNIELGILLNHASTAERIVQYINELIRSGVLRRFES